MHIAHLNRNGWLWISVSQLIIIYVPPSVVSSHIDTNGWIDDFFFFTFYSVWKETHNLSAQAVLNMYVTPFTAGHWIYYVANITALLLNIKILLPPDFEVQNVMPLIFLLNFFLHSNRHSWVSWVSLNSLCELSGDVSIH